MRTPTLESFDSTSHPPVAIEAAEVLADASARLGWAGRSGDAFHHGLVAIREQVAPGPR